MGWNSSVSHGFSSGEATWRGRASITRNRSRPSCPPRPDAKRAGRWRRLAKREGDLHAARHTGKRCSEIRAKATRLTNSWRSITSIMRASRSARRRLRGRRWPNCGERTGWERLRRHFFAGRARSSTIASQGWSERPAKACWMPWRRNRCRRRENPIRKRIFATQGEFPCGKRIALQFRRRESQWAR